MTLTLKVAVEKIILVHYLIVRNVVTNFKVDICNSSRNLHNNRFFLMFQAAILKSSDLDMSKYHSESIKKPILYLNIKQACSIPGVAVKQYVLLATPVHIFAHTRPATRKAYSHSTIHAPVQRAISPLWRVTISHKSL